MLWNHQNHPIRTSLIWVALPSSNLTLRKCWSQPYPLHYIFMSSITWFEIISFTFTESCPRKTIFHAHKKKFKSLTKWPFALIAFRMLCSQTNTCSDNLTAKLHTAPCDKTKSIGRKTTLIGDCSSGSCSAARTQELRSSPVFY